jgi:DNA-binding XRE family transcriptional regulator
MGMSVGEAGWRLGITRREYVAIEDGERPPNANEYEAICDFFGSPDARRQTV